MNLRLEVSTPESNSWVIVSVTGPVTADTAHQLREGLHKFAGSATRIVLDLGEVDSIDVTGVAAVIAVARSTDRAGGWLRVVAPTDGAGLVLSPANTRDLLDLYETRESATEGLT